jgi:hypothetical protein
MSEHLYCQVQDKHGAIASVYVAEDEQHRIVFQDDHGHQFYTELYDHMSPDVLEQYALDWATGKRELV